MGTLAIVDEYLNHLELRSGIENGEAKAQNRTEQSRITKENYYVITSYGALSMKAARL